MAILIRTIKCPYSLTCIYHTKLLILFKMKKGICVLLLVFVLGYYVLGDEVPTEHISNAFKEMDGDGDEKLTLKEVSLLIIIKRDLA